MDGYYIDGITKYTDPLWLAICPSCGRSYWSVLKNDTCKYCGSLEVLCTNPVVEQRVKESNREINQYK